MYLCYTHQSKTGAKSYLKLFEGTGGNDQDEYPQIPIEAMTPHDEWTYTMRRKMQEILPGLYLGPYSAASPSKLESLLEYGITHIVCVRQDIEAHFIKPNFPDRFQYLVLDIADTAHENIIQHFQKVKIYIDDALSSRGRVLVHGNAGISRSAALVLAYMMETYGLTLRRAFEIVQRRRFCIIPNEGFLAQLREFEPIYQAQKTLRHGQQSSARQRSKRTIHQMDTEQTDEQPDAMDS
ncbi:serine/threonine/tyrosine-interacting protein isoform X2 [Neodiprion pinetum]|uniref:Serine/threonine/tyrosine-interacting protein isoform X2 n=1 Tax=Neodiprion lecontei TaxID=441921 RepID=A0ABM3GI48_NEOLC|nr:serine/threonine/tyrosine-interacting protein-like isoform X2 [Neodiprion pinetum]XP_046599942.1 serine/threonine/tyrosine-interacting protein isoform X2 [Neodiprion lecontei]